MLAEDIMTPNVISVSEETTLTEASRLMKNRDVGVLVVMKTNKPSGLISDRDIVIRAISEGVDPNSAHVRQFMTSGCVTCEKNTSVEDVAELMKEKAVRRILVVDRDNRPVGIISIGDVAARSHDQKLTGEVMEEICSVRSSAARP